jgi:hypothetical protein
MMPVLASIIGGAMMLLGLVELIAAPAVTQEIAAVLMFGFGAVLVALAAVIFQIIRLRQEAGERRQTLD